MKKESEYLKWLKLIPWDDDKNEFCPNCNAKTIDYYFIGNLDKRIGYCLIWCNDCLKGIHISRTKIPIGVKSMSFNDAEKKGKNRIPTFQFINK